MVQSNDNFEQRNNPLNRKYSRYSKIGNFLGGFVKDASTLHTKYSNIFTLERIKADPTQITLHFTPLQQQQERVGRSFSRAW